ncbi:MAG TPA: RNA 2',3'-cyclic phosphodiesterase [Gammaproteobacteria bacterium]|jgi:2'-5' RNA ligase|nr:RNA 2',3'-cyclic phosphodiesterase [Gammaproteobacteria bacterium]
MSEPADARPVSRRVFFALWPDDATRSAISRATRQAVQISGGRPIAKDRLHLTVAFLGDLTEQGLALARSVPPIPVGEFEITLDGIGVWPESKILWLAPLAPPPALGELEATLWDGLAECGFVPEERVYRPHVTLARRARPVEQTVEPVRWAVRDLVLVESFPDGRNVHYEVLERWPL